MYSFGSHKIPLIQSNKNINFISYFGIFFNIYSDNITILSFFTEHYWTFNFREI